MERFTLLGSSIRLLSALGLATVAWALPAAEGPLGGDHFPTTAGDLVVHPVNHATLVLSWKGQTIYIDPVGGSRRFAGLPQPDLILLTDIHGDHLDKATLAGIVTGKTRLIAPQAVADLLPAELRERTTVLANDQSKSMLDLNVQAVPMYNLTPDRLRFHTKGRGNGYLLELGGKRVYLSGDTEDIPEMRALKDVDVAFVCMNLPYTMDVQHAAEAVRQFRPKVVYPYHYRGSDVNQFAKLVGTDLGIEVRLREWYK